jgi:release factor glutamine methyltransferase
VTVGAALARATEYLAERGIEPAQVDAELLLGHVLHLTRSGVALERERGLTAEEQSRLERLLERRGHREPLAYVLGEWGFRRLVLRTDARALVPRPETEVVVERCLALLQAMTEPQVLDLGTGSGAIALAIADEHSGARVTAVDASAGALALARENLELTGLADRVELVRGDLGAPPGSGYDLVVSNPPYVAADAIDGLAPEVRDWEPRRAIEAAGQGEAAVGAAARVLRPGGWLVLEVGWTPGEAERAVEQLVTLGFEATRITRDLAGRERVVEGRRH